MKVVVVIPPRAHLAEPSTVLASLLAEDLFYRGVREDAINLRIGRRALYELRV